ncbi:metallophosphoesterase family protein [Litoreibacter ponti]|nr:metallophosphoesterase family protein [Litoreibacter ponti]
MPDAPHFVVGDVHGSLSLLEQMLEQIDQVIGALDMRDPRLVFVGDYIDRGPSSAAVLRRLQELTQEFPDNVSCLLGNHEQMMVDFVDAPSARYKRWFSNGAAQTLRSFGLELPEEPEWQDAAITIGPELRAALGDDLWTWLRARPTSIRSGNLMVAHAGADPGRALEDQSTRVLLWGHPEFLTRARSDGTWVAHGHTVVEYPSMGDGRISVDTGAYETGLLSTAVILPDGRVDFLQTLPT